MTRRRTLILGMLALVAAAPLPAAILVPSTTVDSFDGTCNAHCSLREAIAAANALPGPDVIQLGPGIYTLSLAGAGEDLTATGDLDVRDDLTLRGAGAASTVLDGGRLDRVLDLHGEEDAVVIEDLTVRNGQTNAEGGGIRNGFGELTIARTVVSGNSATGSGGGLVNFGLLTVTASTFSGNTSGQAGGGLSLSGRIRLTNVTVSGNRADGVGGGLFISQEVPEFVVGSTITGNSAGSVGGGVFVDSSVVIPIGDPPFFANTIIAGNTGAPAAPDCTGAFVSQGYNLIGDGSGCGGPGGALDLVGTTAAPLDPRLSPLGANGGPTPTHTLLADSPAIDAGNPAAPGSAPDACPATDQRGQPRPLDGDGNLEARCDIGAVEATQVCTTGGPVLCLGGGRFRVTARWATPQGASGDAQAIDLTEDTGFFWFFARENVELVVKALDACAEFDRFWVFLSGLTNVEVEVTVEDIVAGRVKTYDNPQGTTFQTNLDTDAFDTCP